LNPHRPECGFAYKGLASCGLALSVAAALRKELGANLDLRYWLDLVAVGTVADVAPLTLDNRSLVRAGLEAIAKARRPGMAALLEIAKIDRDAPLTGRDIAFRIAPHINAPGRIGSASLALELLMARDEATARALAAQLDQVSAQRRAQSDEMLLDACAQIEAEGWQREPAIVIGKQGWNPGVVGIVAGRLVERFGCPVIVVGLEGESGRGSVRGPVGSRLYDALTDVAGVFIRFGGHQQAAGLEVAASQLPALRLGFAAAVSARGAAPRDSSAPSSRAGGAGESAELCALEPQDDPAAVLSDLGKLEPCGFGNPRPRLMVKGRVAGAREVRNGHLKLRIELPAGRTLDCFAISQGSRAGQLQGAVTVVGDLRHNSFPGAEPVELFAEEVTPAAGLVPSVSTEGEVLPALSPVAL
jgi:single-stranded-DNA-specific exonuclease